jgi:hypothetical protein
LCGVERDDEADELGTWNLLGGFVQQRSLEVGIGSRDEEKRNT